LTDNGEDSLSIFAKKKPNLVILDIIVPRISGYELCQEIRKGSEVPIIILSAFNDTRALVDGLELGADDYIVKPFSLNELVARIRALLRRVGEQQLPTLETAQKILTIGQLTIDIRKKQVFKTNKFVKLTDIEFSLLELLVTNTGKILSRTAILDRVWGYCPEIYGATRVIDVHVSRLRAKLEENPSNPKLILTVRGSGYTVQNLTKDFTLT